MIDEDHGIVRVTRDAAIDILADLDKYSSYIGYVNPATRKLRDELQMIVLSIKPEPAATFPWYF